MTQTIASDKREAPEAQASDGRPVEAQLVQLLCGHWVTQAIACAARFRIADELAAGPRSSAELASACDADEPSLYRLLRALASIGIFAETAQGTFGLSAMGELLRSDTANSLRELAMMSGADWEWRSHSRLDHTIRSGRPAFDEVHGVSLAEWFAANPEAAANFNAALAAHATGTHAAVAANYDFAGASTIVDLGGGYGSLLRAILDHTSGARGILYDLPHVIEGAADGGFVDNRIELRSGDLLDSVPVGDTYVTAVIHNWPDEQAVAILRNVRAAIADGGRLLFATHVVGAPNATPFVNWLDIEMMVTAGGRERTEEEYRRLFREGGFEVSRLLMPKGSVSLIEAGPR